MENFQLLGTVVNAAVVILGSGIGLLVHLLAKRRKQPKKEGKRLLGQELSSAVMIGIGLCAFLIGVQGAIKAQNILLVILSMAIGAAIGTLLDLDGKIRRLGEKLEKKFYTYHTGYIGGLKQIPYSRMMAEKSDLAVYEAVKGMLPKNSLGRKMLTKLRVYKGAEHNQQAQMPVELKLDK